MALLILFLKGLGVGLAVAAPVGPIGFLCVKRTLDHGPWVGLVSGLGAAGADAFYGAIAGFGLATVAGFLIDFQDHLRLVGGAFLISYKLCSLPARPAAAPRARLIRHSPYAIQIRGNRTTFPPPRELYPRCSHPMA